MGFHLTDGQFGAIIGALVGGSIALVSQTIFFSLNEQRRLKDIRLGFAKQRLDEFYSPMLTRLLEIEYKLWLDHELRSNATDDFDFKQKLEKWDKELAADLAVLDKEIIDIFRRKRWLAFDSTVIECQKLVRYLESLKLRGAHPETEVAQEWSDVTLLKELHVDVRKHHICLLEELGVPQCETAPLIPAEAGGFRTEGELALDKYHASLEQRSGRSD